MNLKTTLSAVVISLALVTSASVIAKPNKSGFNMYRMLLSERAAERLDLTDSQRSTIRLIADAEKSKMKAFKLESKDNRLKLKEMVQADSFDEVAFRALFESGQDARTELAIMKAKHKNQVWNLLTTEQQEKLESIKKHKSRK